MGNNCPLHISVALNLKPDTSVKKPFINVKTARRFYKECIKGNNCKTPIEERNKVLSVAKTFLKYREEDLERILSDEGILLRINRSIQAEGSFGELKQDMQFRRYLSQWHSECSC